MQVRCRHLCAPSPSANDWTHTLQCFATGAARVDTGLTPPELTHTLCRVRAEMGCCERRIRLLGQTHPGHSSQTRDVDIDPAEAPKSANCQSMGGGGNRTLARLQVLYPTQRLACMHSARGLCCGKVCSTAGPGPELGSLSALHRLHPCADVRFGARRLRCSLERMHAPTRVAQDPRKTDTRSWCAEAQCRRFTRTSELHRQQQRGSQRT